MIAAESRTVAELNRRAQPQRPPGEPSSILADDAHVHPGERIVTRDNNRRLQAGHNGVKHGDIWTITDIHPDGSVRAVRDDDPGPSHPAARLRPRARRPRLRHHRPPRPRQNRRHRPRPNRRPRHSRSPLRRRHRRRRVQHHLRIQRRPIGRARPRQADPRLGDPATRRRRGCNICRHLPQGGSLHSASGARVCPRSAAEFRNENGSRSIQSRDRVLVEPADHLPASAVADKISLVIRTPSQI